MYAWGSLVCMFIAGWLARSTFQLYRESHGKDQAELETTLCIILWGVSTCSCIGIALVSSK
jgi:hypothetical protein